MSIRQYGTRLAKVTNHQVVGGLVVALVVFLVGTGWVWVTRTPSEGEEPALTAGSNPQVASSVVQPTPIGGVARGANPIPEQTPATQPGDIDTEAAVVELRSYLNERSTETRKILDELERKKAVDERKQEIVREWLGEYSKLQTRLQELQLEEVEKDRLRKEARDHLEKQLAEREKELKGN